MAWLLVLGLTATIPVLPGTASACFMAYHARRIVLGTSGRAVVVLELDWDRFDHARTIGWEGPVRVGLLDAPDAKLRDVRKLPVAKHKLDRHLDTASAIKKQLQTGLASARSYPGFRAAPLPQHQPCDFEQSCGGVQVAVDAGGVFLSVTRQGTALKVPVTLPEAAISDYGDSPPTKEELAASLKLVSLLSYDIDGREVLVVDLGDGDEDRGDSEDGVWPSCGCADVTRCPYGAATMHHATQFEVVIPLATPAGPPAAMPPPSPPATRLDAGELSRAEGQPKAVLRTDGVYATEPSCTARKGWTRRYFRFFTDGTVRQVDGNVTPKEAFRTTAKGAPWVFPQGKYKVVGQRVSASLGEAGRKWTLDGVLEPAGFRVMTASAATPAAPALFRFVPLN